MIVVIFVLLDGTMEVVQNLKIEVVLTAILEGTDILLNQNRISYPVTMIKEGTSSEVTVVIVGIVLEANSLTNRNI